MSPFAAVDAAKKPKAKYKPKVQDPDIDYKSKWNPSPEEYQRYVHREFQHACAKLVMYGPGIAKFTLHSPETMKRALLAHDRE